MSSAVPDSYRRKLPSKEFHENLHLAGREIHHIGTSSTPSRQAKYPKLQSYSSINSTRKLPVIFIHLGGRTSHPFAAYEELVFSQKRR